jgi:hypothetical protein
MNTYSGIFLHELEKGGHCFGGRGGKAANRRNVKKTNKMDETTRTRQQQRNKRARQEGEVEAPKHLRKTTTLTRFEDARTSREALDVARFCRVSRE